MTRPELEVLQIPLKGFQIPFRLIYRRFRGDMIIGINWLFLYLTVVLPRLVELARL